MILFQPNSGPELVLSEEEQSDNEDKEETELGAMEDQRSVILHLISQLKLGMDLTKVGWPCRGSVCLQAFPASSLAATTWGSQNREEWPLVQVF